MPLFVIFMAFVLLFTAAFTFVVDIIATTTEERVGVLIVSLFPFMIGVLSSLTIISLHQEWVI